MFTNTRLNRKQFLAEIRRRDEVFDHFSMFGDGHGHTCLLQAKLSGTISFLNLLKMFGANASTSTPNSVYIGTLRLDIEGKKHIADDVYRTYKMEGRSFAYVQVGMVLRSTLDALSSAS